MMRYQDDIQKKKKQNKQTSLPAFIVSDIHPVTRTQIMNSGTHTHTHTHTHKLHFHPSACALTYSHTPAASPRTYAHTNPTAASRQAWPLVSRGPLNAPLVALTLKDILMHSPQHPYCKYPDTHTHTHAHTLTNLVLQVSFTLVMTNDVVNTFSEINVIACFVSAFMKHF